MKRPPETLNFDHDSITPIVAAMHDITDAGAGWINLSPEIDEALMPPPPSPIAHLFRSRASEIALATWTPSDPEVSGSPQTLGLSHRMGNKIVPLLDELDLACPTSWRRIQDSPRRGLVVSVPHDESAEVILRWLMNLTVAVTAIESTGQWIAHIYRR